MTAILFVLAWTVLSFCVGVLVGSAMALVDDDHDWSEGRNG